jgi:outer membrane receptor for ferrienterochelin and colicins
MASAVAAGAQPPPDLAQLPFEALMQLRVQQVFGAGDRLQPVTEVPSSVTIVTAEEIARYGYRTVGDILGGVRGFYVTNDRNYSYVGARGFNRPGDYSTRVLLLVNGHRVNDNVYDQASVGAEFGIDAAMFDRVEVIRGPASSLYGTNALFAVVNIVTRSGASLNGASVQIDAGTLGTELARASIGRRLDNGVDFALSGTYEAIDGMGRLFQPAYAAADGTGGVAENLDGEQSGQVYGRFSRRNLTFTGVFGSRLKYVPTAAYSTQFNAHDPAQQTTDRRSSLVAQYVRTIAGTHLTGDASLDYFRYEGVYPYAAADPQQPADAFRDGSSGIRRMVSGRALRPLPAGHTLTIGGEIVENVRQNQWGSYAFASPDNFVHDQSSRQGAAYVQDELKIRPWLLLNGGLRHDRYDRFQRTTPRGAVIVMPSANHSLKYVYGRAFRAPNAYELNYYRRSAADLQPESIHTHEWVWEAYFGDRVRAAVSTYRYEASQLVDLELLDPDASFDRLGFVNAGTIRAAGLEMESELRLKRGAQVVASYTLQGTRDVVSDERLTNSPRHMAQLRVSAPGAREHSFASFEWRYLSRRTTIAGGSVAAMSLAAVTASLPIHRSLELSLNLRNLFNARYADPASDEHLADSIEQNGRTLRVGLRWTFWHPQ